MGYRSPVVLAVYASLMRSLYGGKVSNPEVAHKAVPQSEMPQRALADAEAVTAVIVTVSVLPTPSRTVDVITTLELSVMYSTTKNFQSLSTPGDPACTQAVVQVRIDRRGVIHQPHIAL